MFTNFFEHFDFYVYVVFILTFLLGNCFSQILFSKGNSHRSHQVGFLVRARSCEGGLQTRGNQLQNKIKLCHTGVIDFLALMLICRSSFKVDASGTMT